MFTNNKNTLIIATRQSKLALYQANYVKNLLLQLNSKLSIELFPMTTKGDKILDKSLAKIGGKGLFIKELETALLENTAHIAVHSLKDMPADMPDSLELVTFCERENPKDAFVSNKYENIDALPNGAIIGTSSIRREMQLKALRPDLIFKPVRGNVQTRLEKLDSGEFDAIILAAAGLIRLELAGRIKEYISQEIMLPGLGQGTITIQINKQFKYYNELKDLLLKLNHKPSCIRSIAEREFNKKLNGNCQIPIAGFCEFINDKEIKFTGLIGDIDSNKIIKQSAIVSADFDSAKKIGLEIAEYLLENGGREILAKI